MLSPGLILAVLVGGIHAAIYVLVRGQGGGRVPLILLAAILGAWAGDAIGQRLDLDILTIGDFHLIAASVLAWVGIGFVAVVATLGPTTPKPGGGA